jgi:hypothetical protein
MCDLIKGQLHFIIEWNNISCIVIFEYFLINFDDVILNGLELFVAVVFKTQYH